MAGSEGDGYKGESLAQAGDIIVCFFQAEAGILDAQASRGLGDVYRRQPQSASPVQAEAA